MPIRLVTADRLSTHFSHSMNALHDIQYVVWKEHILPLLDVRDISKLLQAVDATARSHILDCIGCVPYAWHQDWTMPIQSLSWDSSDVDAVKWLASAIYRITTIGLSFCSAHIRLRTLCDYVQYLDETSLSDPKLHTLHKTLHLTRDNVCDYDNAALRGACSKGHAAVVEYLRATFDLKTEDARTYNNAALIAACHNGHLAVVKCLCERFGIQAGDIRAWNNYVLRDAYSHGHSTVVEYLYRIADLTVEDTSAYSRHIYQ